jgi:hypothetical protein
MNTLKKYLALCQIFCLALTLLSCATKDKDKTVYGYRLGDMIAGEQWRDSDGGRPYHYAQFPDSIASEYMRRTNENNRYDILLDILKERTVNESQTPPKDMLLIHLRIGDVIDNTPYMAKDFLSRQIYFGGTAYVKPLSYFQKILEEAKRRSITSITLIGGFHLSLKSKNKSLEYVKQIREFFEKNGMTTSERIDSPPDEDFIYLCNATYYTPSGGGFSSLIRKIVELKGNTIISTK